MKRKKQLKKKVKSRASLKHIIEVRVKREPVTALAIAPDKALSDKDLVGGKEGGKYMIPKSWVSERQSMFMLQKTPAQYILKRPGKGGGMWDYVPGFYIIKALNFAFGWNWDYEVVQEPTVAEVIMLIDKKLDQLWVTGKLTAKDSDGHSITKTQVGRADIKFKKGTREPLDIGNDMKSAHTDALKKCASQFGIASDIYGKHEAKEAGYNIVSEQKHEEPSVPDTSYECHEGGEFISQSEFEYSKKMFGKPLCRIHQEEAKKK